MPTTHTILEAIQASILASYEETPHRWDKTQNIVTLTEDSPDATCREVKLEITDKILVYKFDKKVRNQDNQELSHPLLFLEPTTPIRSTCDYILFYLKKTKKGEKLYVIICNLKSKNKGNMEEQMAAGSILAEFITKTAFRCHNNWNSSTSNQFQEEFTIKEVAFYAKIPSSVYISKGTSKPQKNIKRVDKICGKTYPLDQFCT